MKKTALILVIVLILIVAVVYAGGYLEYISFGFAEQFLCWIDEDCVSSMQIYVSDSMKTDTVWNISQAEAENYTFKVIKGGKLFPVGGSIQ